MSTNSGSTSVTPDGRWDEAQLFEAGEIVGSDLHTAAPASLKLPPQVELLSLSYTSSGLVLDGVQFAFRQGGFNAVDGTSIAFGTDGTLDLPEPVLLSNLVSVTVESNLIQPGSTNASLAARVALHLSYRSQTFTIGVPFIGPASHGSTRLLDVGAAFGSAGLTEHLEANKLAYSQAIWRSLDAATLALLLSPYQYGGNAVTQVIDPLPVTAAGNFLVFRLHPDPAADESWAHWLQSHGIDFTQVEQEIVPLPSGGVFAETVLGRYNSAEKLDLTRFWNWQDSPIPIAAPEITPVSTGSRATPENLTPGTFSQPLINIVAPTSLPDPQGLSGVLSAIQNGNLFRDMSGLAATLGLVQAGLTATSGAAGQAAAQAGTNFTTGAQAQLDMLRAVLPLVTNGLGLPGGATPTNISNAGAKINHGEKLDRRGSAPASLPEGSPGTGFTSDESFSSGGEPDPFLFASLGGNTGSHEVDAFNSSLGASAGQAFAPPAASPQAAKEPVHVHIKFPSEAYLADGTLDPLSISLSGLQTTLLGQLGVLLTNSGGLAVLFEIIGRAAKIATNPVTTADKRRAMVLGINREIQVATALGRVAASLRASEQALLSTVTNATPAEIPGLWESYSVLFAPVDEAFVVLLLDPRISRQAERNLRRLASKISAS